MIPPGYTVLADGTIIGKLGRPLRASPQTRGYLKVNLHHEGQWLSRTVHTLVCEAFHGPKPFPGAQARHLNGNKLDNRADNLRWGTAAENGADRVLHGTSPRGEASSRAKLTEQQVQVIRARYAVGGVLMRELAAEYGVTKKTISVIISRKMWSHI